jgi:Uma2 family endonuclease
MQTEASRVTAPDALMTAEQLFEYSLPDKRVELVRGRLLIREPPGMRHGEFAARLVTALSNFLAVHRTARGAPATLGRVLTCDPGFVLERNPDTVRAPDVAYVSRERFPGPVPVRYGERAPDLAIEIRSPTDRSGAVLSKVSQWLTAGALLVWVIDPGRQLAIVYRADDSQSILTVQDVLDGEDVLPGFALPLADLFAE